MKTKFIFLAALSALLSCTKPSTQSQAPAQTNYSIRIVLSIVYGTNDSIQWQYNTPTKFDGVFKTTSKEIDFTLPGTNGGTYYCSFSAYEIGVITPVDQIQMQVYKDGNLIASQTAIGTVGCSIPY